MSKKIITHNNGIIETRETFYTEKTIQQLKQQLAEKEKENEELKLKLDIRAMNLQNINTERMEAVRNQTQLAIQELEKVKNFVDGRTYCADYIKKRIQELKGE